jgi:hypothetical protein
MSSSINPLIQFIAYTFGFVGFVIGIIYGILAIVPSGPFKEKDVTLGVVLIVLSVLGVIGGAIYCVVAIILMLLEACCCKTKETSPTAYSSMA